MQYKLFFCIFTRHNQKRYMDYDYNTQRPFLLLKEYGRNVQKLAEFIQGIPDREERSKYATTLVGLMRQLNPLIRDGDSAQRIWDHLVVMTDFKLDVNSPFPMPEPESLFKKPKKMEYADAQPRIKHYGKNVDLLIEKAVLLQNEDEKRAATVYIFKLMKTFYATWNRENVEDDVIAKELLEISDGKLQIDLRDLQTEQQQRRHDNKGQNRYHQQGNPQKSQHYGNNYKKNTKDKKFYKK